MSRLLLIGDVCKDVFLQCDVPRLSPEKPCPIAVPHSFSSNMGMAGNVLANLKSLAPDVEVVTLFPKDPSVKTRYVDRVSNQHLLRVDQDSNCEPLDVGTFINILDYTDDGGGIPAKWDGCIISCYGKGFLTTDNMKAIALLCENRGIPVFLDTKAILGEWSQSVTVIKINAKEYAAQLAAGVEDPWLQCKNLIVTQGSKGMVLFDEEGGDEYRTSPKTVEVRDSVGAGDTAIAALVVGYLETQDLARAMDFADKACTIAVSKPGVVAVKREEVG